MASWSALSVEPTPYERGYGHAASILARLSNEGLLRPRLNHRPSPVARMCADRLREADADGEMGVALYQYERGPQDHTRDALRQAVLSHTARPNPAGGGE
jgi:hypothetical protein